ncbi:MAG: hypothetical protein EZS28_015899 [Streblomastix strix]|uniref:TmcB/TmcC TPR repeats domain-containing protein n=1 Tax=Streblomastix strix TaxID=222440 RepID=A0A5J4W1A0_9EUKA|nr:MAG: hypothetical protein EZS28_015899 [Streblomastix strix]
MILYAEVIYTQAVRRHQKNANVIFHYWNHLLFFKKNFKKAGAIIRLIRRCELSFQIKFIIYSHNKGKVLGAEKVDQNHFQQENSIRFLQKLVFAQKQHEIAQQSVIEFFSNIITNFTDYRAIYQNIKAISKAETLARTTYEELLTLQPNNISLLKQYAKLLSEVYRDEEATDAVMNRIQMLDKDGYTLDDMQRDGNTPDLAVLMQQEIERERMKAELDTANVLRSEFNSPMGMQTPITSPSPMQPPNIEQTKSYMSKQSQQTQTKRNKLQNKKKRKKIRQSYKDDDYDALDEVQRFENLNYVCELTSLQTRLAPLFLGCLYQDLVCQFNYKGLNDSEAEFIISWDQICEKLLQYSDQITQTLENIYSILADPTYWESNSIVTYVFDIRLQSDESGYLSTSSSSKTYPSIVHDEPIQFSNKEQERYIAMMKLLSIPKSKLQGIFRKLTVEV